MIPDCTALILSGGESRRMGQDKAKLVLGDKTLLQHVAATLQPMFKQIIVSVRSPRPDCNFKQVCDDQKYAGPLAGLAAGLAQAETSWVFAVACDMPFISQKLIEELASLREGFDAVVPVVQDHPQPMAAFYAAHCKNTLREILEGSEPHSLRALLARLRVRYVSEQEMHESDMKSFFDLDTPADVTSAINMKGANQWNI